MRPCVNVTSRVWVAGDMFEYVVKKNGLKEEEARWFFQQLIVGLDYCHRMVSKQRWHTSCRGASHPCCATTMYPLPPNDPCRKL